MYNFLETRRKFLNLTLEEVGEYCGVGKSTVRKWEKGLINDMGRSKILKLSQILKVSPLDILDIVPDEFSPTDYTIIDKDTHTLVEHQSTKKNPLSNHILIYAEKLSKLPTERQDIVFKMIDELLLSSNKEVATQENLADNFPSKEEMFGSDSKPNEQYGS